MADSSAEASAGWSFSVRILADTFFVDFLVQIKSRDINTMPAEKVVFLKRGRCELEA
ncbi:hypothetical protein [Desulfogranum mediterraneum]|uniref:hypothetical protein n=1 Tax=Desulfogranum mediterraneum TaxID=160661 RepID=UPI00040A67B9|nr:hypothetical protein [Desulfogranum mediterraneum]